MRIASTLVFLFIAILGYSQFDQANKTKIENVSITYDGAFISVFYDITNCDVSEVFYVSLHFYNEGNSEKEIPAKTFSGDIGLVEGGLQKKINWDFKADSIYFNKEIYVKIVAEPKIKTNLPIHIAKSLVFPGWGDVRLSKTYLPFLYGVAGYGSIAASIFFNRMAVRNYENYTSTNNSDLVDSYFKKAQTYNAFSYVAAGVAVASWIADLAGIVVKANKIKKHKIEYDNYYYQKTEEQKMIALSSARYVNTTEAVLPPYLKIHETTLKFTDEGGNQCLNAGEKAVIEFSIRNIGKGVANNLVLKCNTTSFVPGFDFQKEIPLGNLNPNEEKLITIPLRSTMEIPTGQITLNIEIDEALGFSPEPVFITFASKAFQEPQIVIADHNFTIEGGGKAEKGKVINAEVIVQNIGQGTGEKINVGFVLPENVVEIGDRIFYIESLAPNEKRIINFEFIVKRTFVGNEVSVMVNLGEKYGKYSKKNNEFLFVVDEMLDKTPIVVQPINDDTQITVASFKSDIDQNIPVTGKENTMLYVLIIGNEDYKSFQTGLKAEVNVDYAINDARTFYQYAVKTLGATEKNIEILENATSGQMRQIITKFNTIAEIVGKDAEIIVYYAGHGLPDEKTKEPYLIPVDVNGSDLTNAISLDYLFEKLTEYKVKRVTVILDACFSGGARNQSLIANRGVIVEPESGELLGNMVVFSSSAGTESSSSYADKFHGLFTYYFLKKMQETSGRINYKEMIDYLENTVKLESVMINNKLQTPNVQFSKDVAGEWEEWEFVE